MLHHFNNFNSSLIDFCKLRYYETGAIAIHHEEAERNICLKLLGHWNLFGDWMWWHLNKWSGDGLWDEWIIILILLAHVTDMCRFPRCVQNWLQLETVQWAEARRPANRRQRRGANGIAHVSALNRDCPAFCTIVPYNGRYYLAQLSFNQDWEFRLMPGGPLAKIVNFKSLSLKFRTNMKKTHPIHHCFAFASPPWLGHFGFHVTTYQVQISHHDKCVTRGEIQLHAWGLYLRPASLEDLLPPMPSGSGIGRWASVTLLSLWFLNQCQIMTFVWWWRRHVSDDLIWIMLQ